MDKINECDHEFVYMESIKTEKPVSYSYCIELKKVDRFFCKKCLQQRDIVHQKDFNRGNEYPDWW